VGKKKGGEPVFPEGPPGKQKEFFAALLSYYDKKKGEMKAGSPKNRGGRGKENVRNFSGWVGKQKT